MEPTQVTDALTLAVLCANEPLIEALVYTDHEMPILANDGTRYRSDSFYHARCLNPYPLRHFGVKVALSPNMDGIVEFATQREFQRGRRCSVCGQPLKPF